MKFRKPTIVGLALEEVLKTPEPEVKPEALEASDDSVSKPEGGLPPVIEPSTEITLKQASEEVANGLANMENERVFYAKLANPALLKQAAQVEDHQQWEIRIPKEEGNATGGRMRVRRTQDANGEVTYVRTTKTKLADGSEKEVPTPSSVAEFEQFMDMSPRGMIKTRYTFDVEGREEKWEVDTFKKRDGQLSEWVKIDFEFKSTDRSLPALPVGLVDEATLMSNNDGSTEHQALIRQLYDDVFITPNPKVGGGEDNTPTEDSVPAGSAAAADALPPTSGEVVNGVVQTAPTEASAAIAGDVTQDPTLDATGQVEVPADPAAQAPAEEPASTDAKEPAAEQPADEAKDKEDKETKEPAAA